ncbi:MAG: hypothetical protein LLF87_12405 [Eubacteriales bacterium]|nr:hypothetical protein [Eubacteriales bacterium]
MKITNSSVALRSSHALVSERKSLTSLTIWGTNRGSARLSGADGAHDMAEGERAYKAELGARRFSRPSFSITRTKDTRREHKDAKDAYSDARLKLIEELMYMLTGKRIRIKDPSECMDDAEDGYAQPSLMQAQGYGIIFRSSETYFEAESVNFAATGSVETADGRKISFDMRLAMERSYYEAHSTELRLGDAAHTVDPLAINLGGDAIGLTNAKFSFDLDGDGAAENISFLTGGAGFLALDKNGDGKISDGTELFGTRSGDGFKDLAVYDEDKNGWIDEGDSVFKNLKVFNMNEDGTATLLSLGEAGVGALYLGSADTQYSFKQGREVQGELRKSSVYLKENGQAGALHHIDLAI